MADYHDWLTDKNFTQWLHQNMSRGALVDALVAEVGGKYRNYEDFIGWAETQAEEADERARIGEEAFRGTSMDVDKADARR